MSENIWAALAAPLPKDKIDWRIDGKVVNRAGAVRRVHRRAFRP